MLARYGDLVSRVLEDLTATLSSMPSDDGSAIVVVSSTWSGPMDEGRWLVSELSTIAAPLAEDVAVRSPLDQLRQLDGMFPNGAHYAISTCNSGSLTPPVAATMTAAYVMTRSPGSFLNIHHFHGREA